MYGLLNGAIKLFLIAVPALEEESLCHSIIIPTSNSNEHTRTPMEDLSFATSSITENKSVTIAVLYVPNDDDPSFFLNFFDHLKGLGHAILGNFV